MRSHRVRRFHLHFSLWFLCLVQGLKDLVWLPIEQYRKDGRIVRGFQRGAASFGTSTAMAALELTNRMVQTIQAAAETAYDMVSPSTLSIEPKKAKRFPHHRLAHQPVDLREGVAKAYSVVKEVRREVCGQVRTACMRFYCLVRW